MTQPAAPAYANLADPAFRIAMMRRSVAALLGEGFAIGRDSGMPGIYASVQQVPVVPGKTLVLNIDLLAKEFLAFVAKNQLNPDRKRHTLLLATASLH